MDLSDSIDGAVAASLRVPGAWARAGLGAQLRAVRLSHFVSQRHLAESAGVDQSFVSRLERGGDANWETWRRLFAALGHEVFVLVGPSDETGDALTEDERGARWLRQQDGLARRWG